ncbi:MAG: hypothetical protein HC933_12985 [Pleurocapsa sp. SU_196_0]|nr:hypothetical protein [Pleurocapsa sp. SU_196_0]
MVLKRLFALVLSLGVLVGSAVLVALERVVRVCRLWRVTIRSSRRAAEVRDAARLERCLFVPRREQGF